MHLETDSEQQLRSWDHLYGVKHRWARLDGFPHGIDAPEKVRVYRRNGHYILNWWDPGAGKNLSERVDGDLLAALVKAREIDGRILDRKTAGVGRHRRIGPAELVGRFLEDLGRRAASAEVATATVDRYRTALDHYLAYCNQAGIAKLYPAAASADRAFRLGFTAFLQNREKFAAMVAAAPPPSECAAKAP